MHKLTYFRDGLLLSTHHRNVLRFPFYVLGAPFFRSLSLATKLLPMLKPQADAQSE